jgi:hypothetical protein
MNHKFTYNDIITVKPSAPIEFSPGARAWVVALHDASEGGYFARFPLGNVYTIEFEDGSSTEVHEMFLDREVARAS